MIEVIDSSGFRAKIFDDAKHEDWAFAGPLPVIVNFFATWCGPCQMFAPTLQKIADEYQGRVQLYKVDIDASPDVAALFDVRSVPTTLFVRPGEEPYLLNGALTRSMVAQTIDDVLGVTLK